MSIIDDALRKARQEKEKTSADKDKKFQPQPFIKEPGHETARTQTQKTEAPKIETAKVETGAPKTKLTVLAVLILALFLASAVLIKNLNRPSAHTPPSTPDIQKGLALPDVTAVQNVAASKQHNSHITEASEFELTGIVRGEGSPMAIINGGVYMVGDNIKSAHLVEILQDRVILEKNGKKIELKVQ